MLGATFLDWSWIGSNLQMIESDLGQHLELSVIAVAIGFCISLPLSVLIWPHRRARSTVLAISGILYTIPSIALFVIVQPAIGYYSIWTAEIALVSYTLLIFVRNILAGLDAVPDELREAARAMGYTHLGEIVRVDLPLALPAIFAGLRVATVTTVGLVTVAAFIGLGGLGELIIDGFGNDFATPVIVALVLAVVLAGVLDLLLVGLERIVVRWNRPLQRAGR